MNYIDLYNKEIIEDVHLDQLNILDQQMKLPAIRHKWVTRLILAKKNLKELKDKKIELKNKAVDHLKSENEKLPKIAIDQQVEKSQTIQKINEKINEEELHIEYLEKIEKILADMNFAIKNSVDLIKMETT